VKENSGVARWLGGMPSSSIRRYRSSASSDLIYIISYYLLYTMYYLLESTEYTFW